jgi:hypothetical protein
MSDLSFSAAPAVEPPAPAKSALRSLTLQSLVALAVAAALERAGAALPYGASQELAGAAVDLISMIGLVGAAVGRARANGPIG